MNELGGAVAIWPGGVGRNSMFMFDDGPLVMKKKSRQLPLFNGEVVSL